MKCGLLGQKLGHSYSPQIHSLLGNYPYALLEQEPETLADFLKQGDWTGLNVTIPYKKAVIAHLSSLSPLAQKLGAVNTIVRRADGSLVGHNTDYFGFLWLLKKSGLEVAGKKCLVLGSGGASNTVSAVLADQRARVVVISRSGENNYENLRLHEDAALLVNATPVGMYPKTCHSPVELDRLPRLEGVLDLVYNPARTKLVMDAEARGIVAMGGLWMLVAQAKEAAEWFTGSPVSDEKIAEIHDILRSQTENLILIGMPGCGKSTIGRALAHRLGRPFVDADQVIAEQAGMSIPELFTRDGEDGFRARETAVLARLGKASGYVIATGGGCVTKPENYPLLHQNGTIFWLRRELEKLPAEGRPLSQTGSLVQMYALREPLYRRFADRVIDNNGSPEETILQITEVRP